MNILLLGNGFDLHHKFPTAYIDFLHTMKFLVEHYDESTMKNVALVFGDERLKSKCKNIENSFAEYENFYKETSLDADKVKSIIEKAKNNMWFKYFSTAVEKELTWIDFEKEISEVISAFREFFSDSNLTFAFETRLKSAMARFIIRRFGFFIEEVSGTTIARVGQAYTIKMEYITEYPIASKIYLIDKEKIISELYSSLRELTELLKNYLSMFVDSLSIQIRNKGYEFELPKRIVGVTSVISFNYTKTFEHFYRLLSALMGTISHVHGVLGEDIVLGINPDNFDRVETVDTSFIRFKKYFQRTFYQTDIGFFDLLRGDIIRSQPINSVTVIGHSLDKTDEDVIKAVFKDASRIDVLYHNEEAVGKYVSNLVNIFGYDGLNNLRLKNGLRFVRLREFHLSEQNYNLSESEVS